MLTQSQRTKLKISMILLIVGAAVYAACFAVSGVLSLSANGMGFSLQAVLAILIPILMVAVAALAAILGIRFAEKGKKLAAVVFVSLFTVFAFAQACAYFILSLRVVTAMFSWQTLVTCVGFGAAAVFFVLFYAYAYTARRVKSAGLWITALVFGIIAALAIATVIVIGLIDSVQSFSTLAADAGLAVILSAAAELVLILCVIAAILVGMRRVSDERAADVPDMVPVLSAYRKALRKEVA